MVLFGFVWVKLGWNRARMKRDMMRYIYINIMGVVQKPCLLRLNLFNLSDI